MNSKHVLIPILTLGLLLAVPTLAVAQLPGTDSANQLVGTWERTDLPTAGKQIKIFNATHFVWIVTDEPAGRPTIIGGGTYTFDGKTYKETYNFCTFVRLVGSVETFTIDFQGGRDQFVQSGKTSLGNQVRETFKRIK